jgi:transcriptional regulator with XRE-family HTH domain
MSKLKELYNQVDPKIKNQIRKSDQIAQLIEAKLLEKKWSKGRLAEELGEKNQSVITRYLTGQHNFTLKTLVALENALGCTFISVNDGTEKFNVKEGNRITRKTTFTVNIRQQDDEKVKEYSFHSTEQVPQVSKRLNRTA